VINTGVIRGKIIDLALQGKLSSHNDTDSNVDQLLSEIFSKNGGKEKISERDLPFKIPQNWRWIKLGWVMNIDRGGSPRPIKAYITNETNGINWIKIGDVAKDGKYITETKEKIRPEGEKKSRRVYPGDFLLTNSMSFGRPYISKIEGCIHDGWLVLRNSENVFDLDFLYYLLSSTYAYSQFTQKASGSTVDNLNKEKVGDAIVPLPPVEEQKRIVASIERIIPSLSIIDDLQNQYASNLEALNSKLIDADIKGKLTEQLPEDGTAEELYQKIQHEKETLIRSKKLKKAKGLPTIEEDEIPFEIPSNWKWVRIGDVFTLQACKNVTASEIKNDSDDSYRFLCYGGNGVRGYVTKSNVSGRHVLIGRQGALCGNINMADGDFYATEHAVVVYQYANTEPDWAGYVLKALNLNQYATSVAQPGLAVGKIEKVLMPLPPVAEQKRIARKIEDVMAAISIED